MSLKLNERYPGRYGNPSSDYPQGSFKNRTTPVAKDGSYLEKDWANDKEGFFQSLLSAAGIAPNGNVDKVGSSQNFDALLNLFRRGIGTYVLGGGTANAHTATLSPPVTALNDGMVIKYKASIANTGACTFNPNGLGAKDIVGGAHAPLQGGEIISGGDVWLQYNTSIGGGSWVLVSSTGGALQVAAPTQVRHAVNVSDFPCLFSATGYVKFPVSVGGFKRVLILQWVTQTGVGTGGKVDNFPIAFPTSVLIEWSTVSVPGGPLIQYAAVVSPPSLTTIQTVVNTGVAAVAAFALGY
ncbi:gp53-like domain-containing protein [Pseudomonas parasichuanensis]|uniref:gp53-like domain-containing protein n=1 Tax=Pseudomonas parasichuanensis TaxID=2892329 RepID=UPI001F388115|nr:hypothetical protein [Pseudomonas parasichuanensis]